MNGFKNEFDFVLSLNGKKVKELNPMLKDLITNLFGNIDDESIIKCWKNHYKQKSDIFVKINNIMKGISIKLGYKNSVHVEPISSFIHFLIENNIPKDIIIEYLKYHYADGTTNGSGENRISSEEYKNKYPSKIKLINKYFNNEVLLFKVIDRFILQGNNYKFRIDALISGTPDNFVWLNQNQIIDILIRNKNFESNGIHFSKLFIQPEARNLNYNKFHENKRYCIQIKWYSLSDDIISYKAGV